ncbi:hypothetical protein [Allosphingosinicella sp.]|uniref:hypothetical protein n=1 Tax=Allosphingosinicella sp. TaxID=2823234 RepID=UPI002FC15ABC
MHKRKYQITGIDDLGDVHLFLTNDQQRAAGVAEAMREELDEVEVVERPSSE